MVDTVPLIGILLLRFTFYSSKHFSTRYLHSAVLWPKRLKFRDRAASKRRADCVIARDDRVSPLAKFGRELEIRGISFFFTGPQKRRRLANYDKQMRVGNAAVDDCISQGLPDFYFSLFPSPLSLSLSLFSLPLFFFPCFFLSPAKLFCAPPLSLARRGEREGDCSSVEEAAVRAAKEEEARTETLICFFRYSPYFPPRRHPRMLRLLPSFALSLVPLAVSRPPFSRERFCAHPLARLRFCKRPFSPSNGSLFLLRCSAPAYSILPSARPDRSLARSPSLESSGILFSRAALPQRSFDSSFFLSFFLSFFPSFFPRRSLR